MVEIVPSEGRREKARVKERRSAKDGVPALCLGTNQGQLITEI